MGEIKEITKIFYEVGSYQFESKEEAEDFLKKQKISESYFISQLMSDLRFIVSPSEKQAVEEVIINNLINSKTQLFKLLK